MSARDDSLPTIPNTGDRQRTPKNHTSILAVSIENEDLSYIQEFLVSANRSEEIRSLTLKNKERLVLLLVEFLDEPLRLEAIETIYILLGDVGHIEQLSRRLIERSNDFNKLVYLKGKIDYLKYMNREPRSPVPQNEYSE